MATFKINFSNTALTAIVPPATGRDVYRDMRTPGLELRVTPNGTKTFSVFKRLKDGPPERVTLDSFPSIPVDQARKMAGKVFTSIAEGSSPAQVRRAHKQELTFGELYQQYHERHAKNSKKTANEDGQRYKQYLDQPLGLKKISAIDQEAIRAIHSKITNAGHPVVANRVLALISTIFGRAIEWSYVKYNPAKGVRRNKEQSRDRFLQPQEMEKFFAAVDQEPNAAVRDFIYVAQFTGARRANVLAMKWTDLDLEGGIWRIAMTKNGTPQNVVLAAEVIEILNTRKAAEDMSPTYVFPGGGQTGHLAEPRKGWMRVLKAAGIADLRIHDLRRTFGSWQAMTGASLPIIGKSLNHKSPQATTVYARLHNDPVRESIQKATKAMVNAGRKKDHEATEVQQPATTVNTDVLAITRDRQAKI